MYLVFQESLEIVNNRPKAPKIFESLNPGHQFEMFHKCNTHKDCAIPHSSMVVVAHNLCNARRPLRMFHNMACYQNVYIHVYKSCMYLSIYIMSICIATKINGSLLPYSIVLKNNACNIFSVLKFLNTCGH